MIFYICNIEHFFAFQMQNAAGVLSSLSSSDLLMAFRISLNLVERIGEILASNSERATNYTKAAPMSDHNDCINFSMANHIDIQNEPSAPTKMTLDHSTALKTFSTLSSCALTSDHFRPRDQSNRSTLPQPHSSHQNREPSRITNAHISINQSVASTKYPQTDSVHLRESELEMPKPNPEETDRSTSDEKDQPQNLSKDDFAMKWSPSLSSPSLQIDAPEEYEQSAVDVRPTKENFGASVPNVATFSSSPGPSVVSEKTDKLNNLVEQCRYFTDGRRVYRCIYCSKMYEIKSSIRYHLKVVHLKMHLRASNLVCRNCGRRFTCISAINRHHTRCAAGLLGTSLASFVPVTSSNS